jgi:N-acetylglucosaminyldiphosphoundecaprenol N-acetyl-beta-D-mannosaminyltransferase
MSATDVAMRPPALLFGIPIADLTMGATIALIGDLVARGRSSGRTHQIATTNVDFLVNALDEPDLRTILQSADACLADGMPVVWGASLLGMPIRERVAGADLVPLLVEASVGTGWRIHVFGSSPSTAERAQALFTERYPGAAVSIDPGPMIPDPTVVDDAVLDAITAVDADILCVALGNPKQERFIRAHRERLRVPVMIGVGGSLDLLVGERRRAPVWMQRTGTEWIARLVQEPGRLGGRYAHDIRVFGPRLARERRQVRARRTEPGIAIAVTEHTVDVRLDGTTDPGTETWARAVDRLGAGSALQLRTGSASTIHDRALAMLIGLVQIARRTDAEVRWLDDPSALSGTLRGRGIPTDLIGVPADAGDEPADAGDEQ